MAGMHRDKCGSAFVAGFFKVSYYFRFPLLWGIVEKAIFVRVRFFEIEDLSLDLKEL